eukprot:2442002-Prymnesium_polylepis.1
MRGDSESGDSTFPDNMHARVMTHNFASYGWVREYLVLECILRLEAYVRVKKEAPKQNKSRVLFYSRKSPVSFGSGLRPIE